MEELKKIEYYFADGANLWGENPDYVLSREFFEEWELIHKPVPFPIEKRKLSILGCGMEVIGEPSGSVGCFLWDHEEMCASFRIENAECTRTYLLLFHDGAPFFEEGHTFFHEDNEVTYGERLEVMFDVVAGLLIDYPGIDVLNIDHKLYLEALENVADRHSPAAVTVMKRLSHVFVKRLLEKACEDLPDDEIGSKAPRRRQADIAAAAKRVIQGNATCSIESRTPWELRSELTFLQHAGEFSAKADEEQIIFLKAAEIIEGESGNVLRCPVDIGCSLSEGDTLQVFVRGERRSIGVLFVDLAENNAIYGRLKTDDMSTPLSLMYAKPPRSPKFYISAALTTLLKDAESARNASPALRASLGVEGCSFDNSIQPNPPQPLDQSQIRAWSAAVNPNNPIVLIQGPPGTGKTCVLEQVVRTLCSEGKRILVTAPSNTAVDNVCKKLFDLPLLRFGKQRDRIAPTVADKCWIEDMENVRRFTELRNECKGGIYAGTHLGLLRDDIVTADLEKNGRFDVIIFDEAGMASVDEYFLCTRLGNRAVLFGDQQQLPPFPMSDSVKEQMTETFKAIPSARWQLIQRSALEWLLEVRNFPVSILQTSYRCRNPRLLRFASTLFYDARVKPDQKADYYNMSPDDRRQLYPPETLLFYNTSMLPESVREEKLVNSGGQPGIENRCEAELCADIFYEQARTVPLDKITIITPYRKQVNLIRRLLSLSELKKNVPEIRISSEKWNRLLKTRISTVDSFQGSECDTVIISCVRSNRGRGIGFIDDPNRINVAYTRCRKRLIVIGDARCLTQQARNNVFRRMLNGFMRDGVVIDCRQ